MRSVAVVDPFTTGSHLAPAFARFGIPAVAVLSHAPIPPFYAGCLRAGDFVEVVDGAGELGTSISRLRDRGVERVLAGSELGVELSDRLSAAMGLPGNGVALSRARRDKGLMASAVARAGVAMPRTVTTGSAGAANEWARARGWPVVVKPVASLAGDGVVLCAGPAALRHAFADLIGRATVLDSPIDELVVQEALAGTQYFVNSVSVDGLHRITEIWREHRLPVEGGATISDWRDLDTPHGETADRICAYVCAVLDALAIRHGPAHTEVIDTAAGPRLLESAARMQGDHAIDAVVKAIGASHVSSTVEAVVAPERFLRDRWMRYELRVPLAVVSLNATTDGTFVDDGAIAELRTLPGVASVRCKVAPGAAVRRTVNIAGLLGTVCVLGLDRPAFATTHRAIRAINRRMVHPSPPPSHAGTAAASTSN